MDYIKELDTGIYRITSDGRVFSKPKRKIPICGKNREFTGNFYYQIGKEKELTYRVNNRGYNTVSFNHTTYMVHRLVAEGYVNNPDPTIKKYVNHIDGDKSNFNLSNLEWVTLKENTSKAYENNQMSNVLLSRHLNNGKPEQFREIRAREIIQDIMDGYDNIFLAEKYNVGFRYISAIRNKVKFKRIWEELYPNVIVPKSAREYEIKPGLRLSKFNMDTQLEILDKLRFNTNISVAIEYDIDPSVLSRARLNQTWLDSYSEYLKEKIIPLPLKPLINVIAPKYYFLGNRELQLSALLDIINAMLANMDIEDIY